VEAGGRAISSVSARDARGFLSYNSCPTYRAARDRTSPISSTAQAMFSRELA
jgi:hypothetical protein